MWRVCAVSLNVVLSGLVVHTGYLQSVIGTMFIAIVVTSSGLGSVKISQFASEYAPGNLAPIHRQYGIWL